jgi:hypothetical protein
MWKQGYPSPQPLAGPDMIEGLCLTAEAYVGGGARLKPGPTLASLSATELHRFITVAAGYQGPLELGEPVPWVGWEHGEPGLWPTPDDLDLNLNDFDDGFLDELGARTRQRLLRDTRARLLGHADWWNPNLAWRDVKLHCVFDWDSLAFLSEAALAGSASTIFADVWPEVTTMAESEAFLVEYERARGRPWSKDELEVCWAAGLWQLAFNAKKQPHQGNTKTLEHLQAFGAERLRRSGA